MTTPLTDPSADADELVVIDDAHRLEAYVLRWSGFAPLTILSTAICSGLTWWAMGRGLDWILPVSAIGACGAAAVTMLAVGWGSVIALMDQPVRGILFIVFPPYMAYYAVIRFRVMWQPSLLFLCGVAWGVITFYAAFHFLAVFEQGG